MKSVLTEGNEKHWLLSAACFTLLPLSLAEHSELHYRANFLPFWDSRHMCFSDTRFLSLSLILKQEFILRL